MAHGNRFRDGFARHTPWWLSDRRYSGKTVGYRFLWAMIAPLDVLMDLLLRGIFAALTGLGTPTALPWIGKTRGLIRWQDESYAAYAARLRGWLDEHKEAGHTRQIAKMVQGFLRTHPRMRIVSRAGVWITREQDGTVTKTEAAWDWDSVSHPSRNDPSSPYWSDLWIIVYATPEQFPLRPGTLGDLSGADGFAIGHMISIEEVDVLKAEIAQWKAAHSRIRAVIWTTDPDLFDPEEPSSLPDGTWGGWGGTGSGSRGRSGRNYTTCRYWEPG